MTKILVVDDIATNRNLLRQMLGRKGYTIIEAESGQQSLEQYAEQAPDLVLMDISMPGMDGCEAAGLLKKRAGERYVPIIFVTAMKAGTALADALASGGDDYVSKPVDFSVLESKILSHLRIRELNRQLADKNHQISKHNTRLAHEQELIDYFFDRALQQSFLDRRYIRHYMSPAAGFNGDILLVERGPNGGLYGILGDFTGHGLSAAMGTLPVAQVFFEKVRSGVRLQEIARETNRQLHALLPPNLFFSATLFELNAAGDRLSIWLGGMPDAYLIRPDGSLAHTLVSRHMPLGIQGGADFDDTVEMLSIDAGSRLYLYSDGVPENTNLNGEMFGQSRLLARLGAPMAKRFDHLRRALLEFGDGKDQDDDISLVEIICGPVPPVDSGAASAQAAATLLPLDIRTTLDEEGIRNLDPIRQIVDVLVTQPIIAPRAGLLHSVLSELYTNAIDHSLLGLESLIKIDDKGFADYYRQRQQRLAQLQNAEIAIEIALRSTPTGARLDISFSDNGVGFESTQKRRNIDELHGRGLQIISALCDSVEYSNGGRRVDVVYRLK